MPRRQRAGDIAEDLFVSELTRLGCVAWATGGTAGVKQLADGRKIGIRLGCDLLGLFDILAIDPAGVLLVQVKGGARFEGPDKDWRERFARLPHPPRLRYLWAWLGADGWRVERLLPDGTRLRVDWPPEAEKESA
jgi:hypothetical protein